MPVGTAGTVKAMTAAELAAPPIDAHASPSSAAHTTCTAARPRGHRRRRRAAPVRRLGPRDAHRQRRVPVFSLGGINQIDDDGVTFRPIDGSLHRLTAEVSMHIQGVLGADIAMSLRPVSARRPPAEVQDLALRRTTAWAARAVAEVERPAGQALFGIVQGGVVGAAPRRRDRRSTSTARHRRAVGRRSPSPTCTGCSTSSPTSLPAERPRYLMGVGTPADLDAASPWGRHVRLRDADPQRPQRQPVHVDRAGRHLRHSFKLDQGPLDPACPCFTCQTASRLVPAPAPAWPRDPLRAPQTLHNLTFYAPRRRAASASRRGHAGAGVTAIAA
ncbi:MAG: tRNA-guanine transglycosylase [Kofleriaceae bacterium]